MAGGQEYNAYQKKVINRFYEHADTRTIASLQELVSDLALAEVGSKDAVKKWIRARDLLTKAGVSASDVARVCDASNIKEFAGLVGKLSK